MLNLDEATAGLPDTPIADESLGNAMLYSSGTTGRPKGILRPLPEQPPSQLLPVYEFLANLWRFRDGLIYLSPAPLYHAAPHVGVNLTIRMGGTAIIMEHFDAGAVPAADRAVPRHPHPARADDVLAHAQAAGRAAPLRSVVAGDRDPCRGAVPGAGQASR